MTEDVEDRDGLRSKLLRLVLEGAFTAETSATELVSPNAARIGTFSGVERATRYEANKGL